MTPTHEQCREARHKLGLSASRMAQALGLSDGRAVRRFEAQPTHSTARTPQGPLAVLYSQILSGRLRTRDLLSTGEKDK